MRYRVYDEEDKKERTLEECILSFGVWVTGLGLMRSYAY